MKTINFIDLFDWEKESDIHYYSLLSPNQQEEYELDSFNEEYEKRIPTKIKVIYEKQNIFKTKQILK